MPYKQAILYDYKIDESLPVDGPDTVTFGLPDRVTIIASNRSVQTEQSTKKN